MEASYSVALACDNVGVFLCKNSDNAVSSAVNQQSNVKIRVYDRQFLLGLRTLSTLQAVNPHILENLRSLGLLAEVTTELPSDGERHRGRRRPCDRKRKRGCRAGLTAKMRANPFRTPVPSVLLANVRSIENKLDCVKLDLTTKREVRDCCVLILTESWLNPAVPDDAVSLQGLTTFRLDSSQVLSGEACGRGLLIYINEKWSNNTAVVSSQCASDIELLAVRSRPFYVAQEHTTVIILAVYIPPSANTKEALSVLYQTITELQTTHPDGIFIVAGVFNQADMQTVFPDFQQYVDFATRGSNTPDLAYTNIRNAYRAAPRPHLGSSDHLSVMLIPAYRPLLTIETHCEAGEGLA